MATWSRRTFAFGQFGEGNAAQNSFEAHYMRTFPDHWSPDDRTQMMLLQVDEEDGGFTFYMSLPDGQKTYDGFTPIAFAEVPPHPTLSVVRCFATV
jgi:hypothetical protein